MYSDHLLQCFVEAPLAAITVLSLLRYDTTEFRLILLTISEVQMQCPMFFLSLGYVKKKSGYWPVLIALVAGQYFP